jgi:hypothetical protein
MSTWFRTPENAKIWAVHTNSRLRRIKGQINAWIYGLSPVVSGGLNSIN